MDSRMRKTEGLLDELLLRFRIRVFGVVNPFVLKTSAAKIYKKPNWQIVGFQIVSALVQMMII